MEQRTVQHAATIAGSAAGGDWTKRFPRLFEFLSHAWGVPTCLLIAVMPVVLICLFATPAFSIIDDLTQALYPQGDYYGQTSYLMPYTLAPISAPLGLLGKLFPALPVFALCQLLFIIVATTAMIRLASQYTAKPSLRLLHVCLLITCESFLTTYLTYTSVAYATTAAGLALLVVNAFDTHRPQMDRRDATGCLLVFFGTSLRPESGFSTFAFFLPFMVWVLMFNRHARALLRAIVAVSSSVLAYGIGTAAYLLTPGWQRLPHALKVGRAVVDTPHVDPATIQTVVPSLSRNDVAMLYDWWFEDHSIFSLDTFQKISSVVQKYSVGNILLNGKRTLLLAFMAIICLTLLATLLSHVMHQSRRITPLYAGIILILAGLLLILALRNRMPSRVVYPLDITALWAILTVSYAFGNDTCKRAEPTGSQSATTHSLPTLTTSLLAIICALAAILIPVNHERKINASAPAAAKLHNSISAYARAHEEQALLVAANCDNAYITTHSAFETSIACQYPNNLIVRSGLRSYTAPNIRILRRYHLDNDHLYVNLINRDNVFLISDEQTARRMLIFLREHYDARTAMTVESRLGKQGTTQTVAVWRYTRSGK